MTAKSGTPMSMPTKPKMPPKKMMEKRKKKALKKAKKLTLTIAVVAKRADGVTSRTTKKLTLKVR